MSEAETMSQREVDPGGPEDVSLRMFRPADEPAARRLWEAASHVAPVPHAELARKLERDRDLFLVAEDAAGAVVGVVMGAFDGRRGWIFRLAVDPGRRREGIGRMLVGELEGRFAARGITGINLLVLPDNTSGRAFWERLGYGGFDVRLHTKRLGGAGTAPDGPGC